MCVVGGGGGGGVGDFEKANIWRIFDTNIFFKREPIVRFPQNSHIR